MTMMHGSTHHTPLPQQQELTPRQLVLLNIATDLMLDAATARTLGDALTANDPLDILRMLAHQWSKGLTTLSGDLSTRHEPYIRPALAGQFVQGIKKALEQQPALHNLSDDPRVIYAEMLRYMATNMPHQAAWCAARLWHRPHTLN